VLAPDGSSSPRFEVRAVDNQGTADPTPSVEDFIFTNKPPDVALIGTPRPLPDTTFATATLFWTATDPDGNDQLMTFRTWLDGDSLNPHVLPAGARSFTFPSSDFDNGVAGSYTSGPRRVFLQALDDGGMASVPVSFSWYVKAPVTGSTAKLLLVDDFKSANANNAIDRFYRTAVASLPTDSYTILDIDRLRPFRSAKDLEQTFKLFRAVVWYRDTFLDSTSTIFSNYQEAFEGYLASGGHLYINSPRLVEGTGARGAFSQSFIQDYLGSDSLYLAPIQGQADSTVRWDLASGSVVRSGFYNDSLSSNGVFLELRGFAIRQHSYGAFRAIPGTLTPANPFDLAVGVRVPQPKNGLAVMLTFPMPAMGGYPGSSARVMQSILTDLGVYAP
jgi:hypothetical protein